MTDSAGSLAELRVAIDTNGLYTTQAGVARYIRGLLAGLSQSHRAELEILELGWKVENFSYRQPMRMLRTAYRDFPWRWVTAPRQLSKFGADLLHSTVSGYVKPPRGVRHVATLHDMAVFRNPKRFRPWQRFSGQEHCRLAANADQIICISQFTADEVMDVLGVSSSRLSVVYNGHDFHSSADVPEERAPEFVVPDDFFLFVGSLEPGKNLKFLREVYEAADAIGKTLPPLLIVGARWEGRAHEGCPPAGWHYLGRQSDEVLIYLYRRALAFLFPTLYEGFGLPVVEAMALGCPVICAPVASLPEVGGDSALYADFAPDQWLSAMEEMESRGERRKECVEAGKLQAAKFSWRNCADGTIDVYERAMRG